ncbi:hypothetical protein PV963_29390 [Streptomyces coeruleorubidus]|uniref:hypothetical protein n=1 Tax=Streptomyces coeruleorubidus TaxID=116188 RepID=UPI00237FB0AE|nr:hypothetical protein [Streptomyces coeruleorubidus]WDV54179.1 hypothetical protein PV963_29390 [Streptomyces coeruleorubidus]
MTVRLPRFMLKALLVWAARRPNVRVFRLNSLLLRAALDHGKRDQLRGILEWSARQESRQKPDRALFGYHLAATYGYEQVDLRLTATEGSHRLLREAASHDPVRPAVTQTDLSRARADVAKALLDRARRSRERGGLADARRDYRAVIDKREGSTSGKAAHELAEVTDDADEAIELCRTALRFGTEVSRKGPSALLAQLLQDSGDTAGAAAARAHLDIPRKLHEADAEAAREYGPGYVERDSDHSRPGFADVFAPLVVAVLRDGEVVEHVRHSALRMPYDPARPDHYGCLVLTDQRLLFLKDREPPACEALAVDRSALISVRAAERDERGRTWMDIRAVGAEQVSVRTGRTPDTWLTGLGRSYS